MAPSSRRQWSSLRSHSHSSPSGRCRPERPSGWPIHRPRRRPVHRQQIGQWTHPFEEGGAETPRCERKDALLKGEIFCKVAAVTMAALPDGRIYYANGIEADENVKYSYEFELGNRTRADRTRVLDLRGPSRSGPPRRRNLALHGTRR